MFLLRSSLVLSLTVCAVLAVPTSAWHQDSLPDDISQQVSLAESSQRPLRDQSRDWYDPRALGGRMLDYSTDRGKGEPLNIIISAQSDPFILTDHGFRYYARSIGYSAECLGLHMGRIHVADLGDGHGRVDEHYLARQYYFPVWGTCWESFAGGNHFRAWKQNGTLANSGAWFIAASKEKDSRQGHMIVRDGYNIGRDWFVDRAAAGTHWNSMWWRAEVEWNVEDLLKSGNEGQQYGAGAAATELLLGTY